MFAFRGKPSSFSTLWNFRRRVQAKSLIAIKRISREEWSIVFESYFFCIASHFFLSFSVMILVNIIFFKCNFKKCTLFHLSRIIDALKSEKQCNRYLYHICTIVIEANIKLVLVLLDYLKKDPFLN